MAIELPNGKISRTLPEQVGFNSEKIYEIIKFLNESGLKDQVINLTSLSGTLTPEQYAIAELSPSYIVYEGTIFFKGVEDLSNIDYFELIPQIETDSSMLLNVSRIRIVRDTRAYSLSYVNLFETYNKSQIDALLSAGLALKADLSGANFTGPITAPSIIETMTGYSATLFTPEYFTIEPIYVSASKTGNKLTVVFALNITKTDAAAAAQINLVRIGIPAAVLSKLYPSTISGDLDNKVIHAFSTGNAQVAVNTYIQKASQAIVLSCYTSPFVVNTKYYFRCEATFLLNDSLIF